MSLESDLTTVLKTLCARTFPGFAPVTTARRLCIAMFPARPAQPRSSRAAPAIAALSGGQPDPATGAFRQIVRLRHAGGARGSPAGRQEATAPCDQQSRREHHDDHRRDGQDGDGRPRRRLWRDAWRRRRNQLRMHFMWTQVQGRGMSSLRLEDETRRFLAKCPWSNCAKRRSFRIP